MADVQEPQLRQPAENLELNQETLQDLTEEQGAQAKGGGVNPQPALYSEPAAAYGACTRICPDIGFT